MNRLTIDRPIRLGPVRWTQPGLSSLAPFAGLLLDEDTLYVRTFPMAVVFAAWGVGALFGLAAWFLVTGSIGLISIGVAFAIGAAAANTAGPRSAGRRLSSPTDQELQAGAQVTLDSAELTVLEVDLEDTMFGTPTLRIGAGDETFELSGDAGALEALATALEGLDESDPASSPGSRSDPASTPN